MKTLLIALIAFFAAFAPMTAHAMPSVPKSGAQICSVYGNYTDATKSKSNMAAYKECGNSNDMEQFVGFRIEPMIGTSFTPIMKGNVCFFLTNVSKNAYFVPAATDRELLQFLAHKPFGVNVVPCTAPQGQEISLQDRCGGKLTVDGNYANGFEALGIGRAGLDVRKYTIVDATGALLRHMTATATQNGWTTTYDRACPSPNGAVTANAQAVQVVPAAFDRNGGTQRVLINDGALGRNIRG